MIAVNGIADPLRFNSWAEMDQYIRGSLSTRFDPSDSIVCRKVTEEDRRPGFWKCLWWAFKQELRYGGSKA